MHAVVVAPLAGLVMDCAVVLLEPNGRVRQYWIHPYPALIPNLLFHLFLRYKREGVPRVSLSTKFAVLEAVFLLSRMLSLLVLLGWAFPVILELRNSLQQVEGVE